MAEDLNDTVESVDPTTTTTTTTDGNKKSSPVANTDEGPEATSPPPNPSVRRGIRDRERDSRERRDDRDLDRPPRREYYERNRSSPPPPVPRERDYNKRGRPSSSPPPPVYRDRRGGRGQHSPPPRRSPPFKRRRDDGYAGRRGSPPRGGYGPGDRRFGNDHPGGYDREMGFRPGHPDDRRNGGRHMGRGGYQGGPSEWNSGRGGFHNAFNAGGNIREGMMSYKQFIQELEDDILPAEAEKRYQEYKTGYISTQKKTYFNAHKDEEWLKNKYHPSNLITVIERRNELAKKLSKEFQLVLQAGTLDLGPNFIPSLSNKADHSGDPNSDDEANMGGKQRRPVRDAKENDFLSAPKAHPICSEPRRILVDVEQAQGLVRKLDSEKRVEDNVLCRSDNDRMSRDKSLSSSSGPVVIIRGTNAVRGLEGVELLDTLVTYLWRVHGVDYYGLVESNDAKGLRHVRAEGKIPGAIGSGNDFERKLDSHWQERLNGSDPMEVLTAKDKLDAAASEGLDPYVRKIRDEKYGWKYGCGAKGCTKLFHASEFVQKHLKLKHFELVSDLTSKLKEELYFQNYMNDENAPGSAPIMQQSFPKEMPQRRRPGMENRLKDDRGNRNRANGNENFNGPENSQSNDGAPGDNPDEQMFHAFPGQGIDMSSFSSDIAPHVLMPVPGAGPLGPFVPAPPEVAMRMMRDQGGPSPFEGGPQIAGPAPMILPPTFRQDPRRMRSYNDLDAPDDEVTVIDYRSL